MLSPQDRHANLVTANLSPQSLAVVECQYMRPQGGAFAQFEVNDFLNEILFPGCPLWHAAASRWIFIMNII
ncbi:protein of unknown function [Hyphomicrobium sp. MC1]|nr:protein of unknown function [Hyphomicrobium sp. MC1]